MKTITAKGRYQKSYKYKLSAPIGRKFDPEFNPELTPKEMLELGIFSGFYFEGTVPTDIPKSWLKKAKLADFPDDNLNFFKVEASQPRHVWEDKGWLYKDDPHGWFQWYCRYYLGRRIPDEDARQIKRWKAIKRHVSQIKKNCKKGDFSCRPKQRQALLHWAYDSRKL